LAFTQSQFYYGYNIITTLLSIMISFSELCGMNWSLIVQDVCMWWRYTILVLEYLLRGYRFIIVSVVINTEFVGKTTIWSTAIVIGSELKLLNVKTDPWIRLDNPINLIKKIELKSFGSFIACILVFGTCLMHSFVWKGTPIHPQIKEKIESRKMV
jgi:hypothetical protein